MYHKKYPLNLNYLYPLCKQANIGDACIPFLYNLFHKRTPIEVFYRTLFYLIGNYNRKIVISYITQKCTLIPSRLRGRGVEVFYRTLFYFV